jgi:hypothetical protein
MHESIYEQQRHATNKSHVDVGTLVPYRGISGEPYDAPDL